VWSTDWQAWERTERQGSGASPPDRGQLLGCRRQEPTELPGGLDRVAPRADRLGRGGPLIALLCPEPRLRRILRLALESHGYRLVEWSGISRQVEPVDAIVADLDGLGWRPPAALAALRAAGLANPPALLFISVYPPEAGETGDAGSLAYLQPPFSPREFLARVGQLLQRANRGARPGPGAAGNPPPTGELRSEARASDL
jgi:DNA-binding response OmpR family regulator